MDDLKSDKRILLVDDSELWLAGLKFTVSKAEWLTVVGEASNGMQAIQKVRQLIPDLVVMDISMPVMDGLEAAAKIKEEFPNTRVLIISSNEEPETVRRALLAGADGYCLKTIGGNHLMAAIQSVSFGATWLDPIVSSHFKTQLEKTKPIPCPTKPIERLSSREQEVLELLTDGLTNLEIAERLCVSKETVKSHVRHIFEKLCVRHRAEAIVEALKRGLVAAA